MAYEPFYERFRELALQETRSITIRNNPGLPDDEYGFLEAYCNDENCDCQRVMFNVASRRSNKIVAVIAYGWESEEFYARWFRRDDPDIIRQMQGPILNPGSEQAAFAPALLEVVRNTLLTDPAYIDRLKRHYRMFKEKVDPKHFKTSATARQRGLSIHKARRHHRPRTE